jgi:hypothetical protein
MRTPGHLPTGGKRERFSKMEQASELEWLQYFYCNANFGPADDDVRDMIKEAFTSDTGKSLPGGYDEEE